MIHRFIRNRADPRSETIWLTVYADMMTNLMLVFLAMYGLTIMGKDALTQALGSMHLENPAPLLTPSQFERLAPALRETVGAIPGIKVINDVGAVRLQFGENVLFRSGSARLKDSARAPLSSIAVLLKVLPHTIVVEGHTDNQAVARKSGYRGNYELSLARSMAVVRLLIDEGGIPSGQIASAAYGEFRPRAANDTDAGRRLNRRVEISIFRDFPYVDGPAGAAS